MVRCEEVLEEIDINLSPKQITTPLLWLSCDFHHYIIEAEDIPHKTCDPSWTLTQNEQQKRASFGLSHALMCSQPKVHVPRNPNAYIHLFILLIFPSLPTDFHLILINLSLALCSAVPSLCCCPWLPIQRFHLKAPPDRLRLLRLRRAEPPTPPRHHIGTPFSFQIQPFFEQFCCR